MTRAPTVFDDSDETPTHRTTDTEPAPRPLGQAVWNGFRGRCPHCGSGPLLQSYLKVRPYCPVCEEDFRPQRADDGPAYLTILIVGHLMIPGLHIAYAGTDPNPMIVFTILSVFAVALSLYLLPRLKGAMVGFQWAKRMHGFDTPP